MEYYEAWAFQTWALCVLTKLVNTEPGFKVSGLFEAPQSFVTLKKQRYVGSAKGKNKLHLT